jgi:hypothetical protein
LVEYATDGIRFEDSDTRFNNYALGNVTVQRCSGNGVWTTSGQYALVTLNNFQLWTNSMGLSANGPVTLVGGQAMGNSAYGIYGNNAVFAGDRHDRDSQCKYGHLRAERFGNADQLCRDKQSRGWCGQLPRQPAIVRMHAVAQQRLGIERI